MSLLLDALRRAAAAKQGAEEQYTVPRRDDATSPAPRARRPVQQGAADAGTAAEGRQAEHDLPDPELRLEPRAEAHPRGGRAQDTGPAPAGTQRARQDPAAATRALLGSSRRGRRIRLALAVLGTVAVAAVALATAGWLYYQDSRSAVEQDLSAYRPERAAARTIAANASEPVTDAAGAQTRAADGDSGQQADRVTPKGGANGTAAVAPGTDAEPTAAPATADGTERPRRESSGGTGAAQATAKKEDDAVHADAAAGSAAGASATDTADKDTGSPAAEPQRQRAATPASQGGQAATDKPPRKARPLVRASGQGALAQALQEGYQAYQAGDIERAARAYSQARSLAPDNRDALLGAAAVADARGDSAAAQRLYRRVLRDHPHDAYARAALSALDGAADPRRSETELKMLLRDAPDAPELHFALGNLYAREARWAQAQSAYFDAVRVAPDDPQYTYNLAIALDHLGQADAARRYYRRALALADGRPVPFEPAAVRRRLEQLR